MRYAVIETFKLNTPLGLLEISPGQNVLLEPERALRLVEVGKLKLLAPETADIDEYCALCSETVRHIDADYYPRACGWIYWLKNHKPNLWEEIEAAERNLESPIEQGISLEKFCNFVDQWEARVKQGIELYLCRGEGG